MTRDDDPHDVVYNHRHIRDPLYGFIGISKQENDLIDAPDFLRLRRIKQLSHTYVVYPSAVHTRFEHSLGAMYVASRMCDALGVTGNDKRVVRLSALLHDIGHGPFSHLFEEVLETRNHGMTSIHEKISTMMIKQDPIISSTLGSDVNLVNRIIQGFPRHGSESIHTLMHSIVSGNLDADKLDYLRRDSYHIGAQYGVFDLERIIHTLERTPGKHPMVSVSRKGVPALENYRLSRYMMHVQVYKHHARLAADRMFLRAMDIAINDEHVFSPEIFNVNSPDFLKFYRELDDDSIYSMIIDNDKSNISKKILRNIRNRKLIKRASQFEPAHVGDTLIRDRLRGPDAGQELESLQNELRKKLPLDDPSDMLICYQPDIQAALYKKGDLSFVHHNESSGVSDVSPFESAQSKLLFYVYGPGDSDTRYKINELVAKELDADPNTIRVGPLPLPTDVSQASSDTTLCV